MTRVGAYEAKTHLSELLERVRAGERIIITKHGTPIAELGPPEPVPDLEPLDAVAQLRRFRTGNRLGDLSIRDLIEEGRR